MRRAKQNASWRAWLELLRLPNLFTVPGDVLAGWCLAGAGGGWGALLPTVLGSLCLYAAGLLFNDLFDARIDARERPSRPIPSGRVTRGAVVGAAAALSAAGVLLAPLRPALWLLGAIVFYDALAKRVPGLGVLTMGCCRGLNLLLGAACAWPAGTAVVGPLVGAAIAFFVLYTLLLSVVARNEASPDGEPSAWLRWSPALLILALAPFFWLFGVGPLWGPPAAAALLAPVLLIRGDVPALVAGLIRHLIPLQLLWCLAALPPGGGWVVGGLLACWGAALAASRRFAGS